MNNYSRFKKNRKSEENDYIQDSFKEVNNRMDQRLKNIQNNREGQNQILEKLKTVVNSHHLQLKTLNNEVLKLSKHTPPEET